MRRLAVDLDRAREHEARDARRARRRARGAPWPSTFAPRYAAAGSAAASTITCARPARWTIAAAPATSASSSRVGRAPRGRAHGPQLRGACAPAAKCAARRRGTAARSPRQCAHSARPMKPPAPVTTTGRAPSPGRSEPIASHACGRSGGRSARTRRCARSPCARRRRRGERRETPGSYAVRVTLVEPHAPVEVLEVEEELRVEAAGGVDRVPLHQHAARPTAPECRAPARRRRDR